MVEEMVVPSFILTRESYSVNTNVGNDEMQPDLSMPDQKEPDLNLSQDAKGSSGESRLSQPKWIPAWRMRYYF